MQTAAPKFEAAFPQAALNHERTISGAVYKGPAPMLKGKTAIVRIHPDYVEAQFDDRDTGYGFGWHVFHLDDFEGLEAGDLEAEAPEPDVAPDAPQTPPEEAPAQASGEPTTAELIGSLNARIKADKELREMHPGLAIGEGGQGRVDVNILDASMSQLELEIQDVVDKHVEQFPPRPLLLPEPRHPLHLLAENISKADVRLKQAIPILIELRDLARVFAWGLVSASAAAIVWGLVYWATH